MRTQLTQDELSQAELSQDELSQDELSKDAFFQQLAKLSEEMADRHGKDFSMGALVLAARWIAESKLAGNPAGKQRSPGQDS